MSDSDIADEVEIEEIERGGGKVKRIVGALGLLAVLFVVLKLVRGGSSDDGDSVESAVERIDDEKEDEDRIDTISTRDEDDDSESDDTLEVKTSSSSRIGSERLEDLDVVDYLAIFAAALQAARDEYRIRTER